MSFVTEKIYEFDRFRLDAENCVLLDGQNQVVDLTPKALQILSVIVEASGRVVSKEEIIKRVWADSFVEEANLSHHVFRLRKALGETGERKFIETIPKRGYRFVAQVKKIESEKSESENRNFQPRPQTSSLSKSKILIVSAAILLLISGIAAFVWFGSKTSEKPVSVKPAAPPETMSVTRVTNYGKVAAATVSPDGKFVAYIQNYTSGEGMLYVRQVETGAEAKLLEPDERMFGSLAFSPDGSFVYYIVYDKRDPEGALYRIPVLGGQPTRILENVKYMFTLAPDGQKAAFFRDEPEKKQNSLIVAALDGSGVEQKLLTRPYEEMIFGVCPAWSADGKLIAFSAAENPQQNGNDTPQMRIFTIEPATGETKKILDEPMLDTGKMSWMPDGSGIVLAGQLQRTGVQIYFLSYPAGELRRITKELTAYGNYGLGVTRDGKTLVADLWESTSQLWAIEANGSTKNAEQLTTGVSDGSRGLTTFSDGGVVYASRTGDDFDLWLMNEKNGRREGKPLTSDAFHESEICATPDDRYIVFASNRGGNQHLFRMNAKDGSDVKQLTFGESFDAAPDCSPDGNSVVYSAQTGDKAILQKISIEGGEPVRLTDYEAIVPTFSPDGKFIACILPSESQVKPAVIAVISSNGGAPLKTFSVLQFAWIHRPVRWTPDGNALVFYKNEKLVGNLWRQNLSGGEPAQITDFKSEVILNHGFSRDGKRLIIARGKFGSDIVMIKNFRNFDAE